MDKRFWFVVGSIIVVILLSIAWGILLFFGPGDAPGTFTDFTFEDQPSDLTDEPPTDDSADDSADDSTLTEQRARLRQLTTRDTIAHTILTQGTSSLDKLRLIERGTGNVYDIDIVSGQETSVGNINRTGVSEGWISRNGEYIVVREGFSEETLFLGTFSASTSDFTLLELSGRYHDAHFTNNNELLLSEITSGGLNVQSYNITDQSVSRLFAIPFRAATIEWANTRTGTHVVYPRPSRHFLGAPYLVDTTGNLVRVPVSGYGLTSIANDFGVVATHRTEQGTLLSQYLPNDENLGLIDQDIALIPEKCSFDPLDQSITYCGGRQTYSGNMPEAWLRGEFVGTDSLWRVDLLAGGVEEVINLSEVAGRDIVTINTAMTQDGKYWYFVNHLDGTIWIYELY